MRSPRIVPVALAVALTVAASAESFKPLPPPATRAVADADRQFLQAGVANLGREIESLRSELKDKPELLALLPDVQIYENAVRYPLAYNEELDVKQAQKALDDGMKRVADLRDGRAPWVTSGGPRGYLSRVDRSVQPYLLAVPPDYRPGDSRKYPLLIFCHGRGENLLELRFINGKFATGSADKPSIPGAFFVQPYGRFCCANKFAGEIDTLEVLESIKRQYPTDDNRVVLTGFSMGGAAVWHLAVHYPDLWCAASPGAGFCETKLYQKLAERGELATIPWYEQTLWHWYDAPDYVINLFDVPLIAYAGTEDPQQQSGTIMEAAAKAAGVPIQRIWGQDVGHKYEPKAKKELEERLAQYATSGRSPSPAHIKFETWTLRYNKSFWLTIDGLQHHWRRAVVEAEMTDAGAILTTHNVAALTLPVAPRANYALTIDGARVPTGASATAGGEAPNATYRYVKTDAVWKLAAGVEPAHGKRHTLQGPIDDAFVDSFLMVRPTGQPLYDKLAAWTNEELAHAMTRWHAIFRGEAPIKADIDVTDADIRNNNLVLWGDPSSNKILARIADKLPIRWSAKEIALGSRGFPSATHVPILIYPNPLNPNRYVVLNSGFTFREESNATNSRQTPKLPDYAIVDTTTPPDGRAPGKIAAAGFFDERWELQPDDGH
jgi:pimeloyl-ACP methyl ester carboxylesterase